MTTEQKCCQLCVPGGSDGCLTCPCHTEQKGWRTELQAIMSRNFTSPEIEAFIERTLQNERESERKELVKKVIALDWEKLSDDGHTVLIPKPDVLSLIKGKI